MNTPITEKILFVDDDANILQAYRRHVRREFSIETALGGEQGLAAIKNGRQFAVVVSDMCMPGMDGIQFLSKVKEIVPDTVRMMLTGHADQKTAIEAVNEGNIFRFLTKPCAPADLSKAVLAGVKQYRLVNAEKELLEKTLRGSVNILTEMLSLVNPIAFGRAVRIKRYVLQMAGWLRLSNIWQFELAAMLSQLGCVTLSEETLKKLYSGQELTLVENQAFRAHPSVGRKLLENIPRLESVARMIANQQQPMVSFGSSDRTKEKDAIGLGAQMLKIALDFDDGLNRGMSVKSVLAEMRNRPDEYNQRLLAALNEIEIEDPDRIVKSVFVRELTTSMIIDEDVRGNGGVMLVARGQEVSEFVVQFLRNYTRGVGVEEPFRVILNVKK